VLFRSAVHAGWRGTAARAVNAAVEAMKQHFGSNPRDILAGIGPAIGPCCYTVGPTVEEAFADRAWAMKRGKDGGTLLDLWEANRRGLIEAGVPAEQVEVAGICTQCHAGRFFSHRANSGQPAGRFAAVIGLTGG
jgi:copper oxidase (laccase) domain-containing protein